MTENSDLREQLRLTNIDQCNAEAEIDALNGVISADNERLFAAATKAGINFYGCDTADWLAETICELKAEIAKLKAEIERLRAALNNARVSDWRFDNNKAIDKVLKDSEDYDCPVHGKLKGRTWCTQCWVQEKVATKDA